MYSTLLHVANPTNRQQPGSDRPPGSDRERLESRPAGPEDSAGAEAALLPLDRSGPAALEVGRAGALSTVAERASRAPRPERRERMTFRLPADLAASLRRLPNQTAFVERVVRESLGQLCPLCQGSGQAPLGHHLSVSDLKRARIGRLDRPAALQLKALVRLGRQLPATDLELAADCAEESAELGFRLLRDEQVLLSGRICRGTSEVVLPEIAADTEH